MEKTNEKSIKNEIFDRFTEPVKYKLKFFQIVIVMYLDQIASLFSSKYSIIRNVVEEKKSKIKRNELTSEILRSYVNYKKFFIDMNQNIKAKLSQFCGKFIKNTLHCKVLLIMHVSKSISKLAKSISSLFYI